MQLSEAKRILRANGYRVVDFELYLNEGDAKAQVLKVKELLGKWGKKLFKAKKEKDTEAIEDVTDDVKELKDEIYDKGILNKFRNNKGLGKAIFGAMAILMLAGGVSSAHAAATAQPYLGSGGSAPTATAFSNAMDDLDFYCGDSDNCTVDINGDDVTVHKDGVDTHHSYKADHGGVQSNGHVDDGHSGQADNIKLSVDSQHERNVGKTHGTMYTINVHDASGHSMWNVFKTDDGKVYTDTDPLGDAHLKPANAKQVAWLNAHGGDFLK